MALKVRAANSLQAKQDIETMSDSQLPQRCIRFVPDGVSQWGIITYTAINWEPFAYMRQFMLDNTTEIDYVPAPDETE